MKVLLLLSFAVLAYGKQDNLNDKLSQVVADKCQNNTQNENAFEDLQLAILNFHQCKDNKFTSPPPNPIEDHKGFCAFLIDSEIYGCVESWTKSLVPCLDDTEKYLPDFLLRGLNSTYDELCGVHGVENSKFLFNAITNGNVCTSNILHWNEIPCFSELHVTKNLQDNGIMNLNKNDVCHDLEKFQTCLYSAQGYVCKDNEESNKLIDLGLKPFLVDCNDLIIN